MWEKEKTQLRSLLFALSPWFPPGKEGGTAWEGFPIRNLFLQLKKRDLEALEVLRVMPGPCRDLPMAATSAAGIAANLHFEKPFISLPPLPPPATCPELFLLLQGLEKGGIVQIFLIFCYFKCKKKKTLQKAVCLENEQCLILWSFMSRCTWRMCGTCALLQQGFLAVISLGEQNLCCSLSPAYFLSWQKMYSTFTFCFSYTFFFFFFEQRRNLFLSK